MGAGVLAPRRRRLRIRLSISTPARELAERDLPVLLSTVGCDDVVVALAAVGDGALLWHSDASFGRRRNRAVAADRGRLFCVARNRCALDWHGRVRAVV